MPRHTISHADRLFAGALVAFGLNNAQRGIEVSQTHRYIIEDALAPDADGIATAQQPAGAENLTLDGAFVDANGVGQLDYARNIGAVSANAGDTTQTLVITGTDIAGNPLVAELALNGTTAVFTAQAFRSVISVAIDAAAAGNITVGTPAAGDTEFGLPGRLLNGYDVLHALDGAGGAEGGVFTVADVAAPTNATGDARGTYNPSAAPDGSADYVLYYVPDLTKEGYGVNYTG